MRRLPVVSVLCLLALVGCKEGDKEDGGGADESSDPKAADGEGSKGGGAAGVSGLPIARKCDEAKLLALTGTLKAKDARKHADVVARVLPDACELPPAVKSFLAVTTRPDEATPAALDPDAPKHAHEAFTEVCAAADLVAPAIAKIAADERMPLVYDKCKYDRFDLMERDAYLGGQPSSPVPWFAYDWLHRQGFDEEGTKLIGRALIYRDRTPVTVADQTLAAVDGKLPPVPQGAKLHVSRDAVVFDSRNVARIDADGAVEEMAMQGHLISPLYDVLAEQADIEKQTADIKGDDWNATVLLVADASTPFSTLVNVMYTAGRAEYRNYALVAETGPVEYGAIPIEPPKFMVTGRGEPPKAPPLQVIVTAKGFTVPTEGAPGTFTMIPVLEGKSGVDAYDFAKLSTTAIAHRDEHRATAARVTAETDIRFDVFVRTLDAVRGKGCGVGGATCTLPDVVVEAGAGGSGSGGLYAMKGPAGVLGTMSAESGHFLASPYGAAFAVGNDDEDVWGGLTGTEVGEAFGVGSLGLVGTGRGGEGGGGTGEGTIGLGTTGLIGKGGGGGTGSGYGRGSGAGFGGRGKRVPRVRQAKATVDGAMDKDIIRRIVRAHINEVRYCYNQGLTKDEELKGRVTIDFEIGLTGKVSDAEVTKTTLDDEDVGTCIAKAVKRWKFPRPSGSDPVGVTYPFVLEPG